MEPNQILHSIEKAKEIKNKEAMQMGKKSVTKERASKQQKHGSRKTSSHQSRTNHMVTTPASQAAEKRTLHTPTKNRSHRQIKDSFLDAEITPSNQQIHTLFSK